MKVFEKVRESFDKAGHEGYGEDKAAKKVNTSRAVGYRGLQLASLVSVFVFAGGFRHAEGSVEDKIAGGIGTIADTFTGVAKNSQGNWDMPFFDFPGIDLNSDENMVSLQRESVAGITNDMPRTPSNGVLYSPLADDRSYEAGDYAVCDGQTEPTVFDGTKYVNEIILELNPGLFDKAAALNVAYNEFEDILNPGINADSVPVGSEVIFPTDCRLQ